MLAIVLIYWWRLFSHRTLSNTSVGSSEEWLHQLAGLYFLKQNLLQGMESMKKICHHLFLLWSWYIGYCYQFLLKLRYLHVFSKLTEPHPCSYGSTPLQLIPRENVSVAHSRCSFLPQTNKGLMKTLESGNLWERREKRQVYKVRLVHRERRKSRRARYKGGKRLVCGIGMKLFFRMFSVLTRSHYEPAARLSCSRLAHTPKCLWWDLSSLSRSFSVVWGN